MNIYLTCDIYVDEDKTEIYVKFRMPISANGDIVNKRDNEWEMKKKKSSSTCARAYK